MFSPSSCTLRGLRYEACQHSANDSAHAVEVADAIDHHRPWAVVDASRCPAGDDDEHEPQRCFRENMWGPALLAPVCICRGIQILTISSAFFFDRKKSSPDVESRFITKSLQTLAGGQSFIAVEDATLSPTHVHDLVHALLDLLIDGQSGPWPTWATLSGPR